MYLYYHAKDKILKHGVIHISSLSLPQRAEFRAAFGLTSLDHSDLGGQVGPDKDPFFAHWEQAYNRDRAGSGQPRTPTTSMVEPVDRILPPTPTPTQQTWTSSC